MCRSRSRPGRAARHRRTGGPRWCSCCRTRHRDLQRRARQHGHDDTVRNASGRVFAGWISGPTTGGVEVIVTLRKAWAPSMPTHNVEPSSESASAFGSEPIGMAEARTASTGRQSRSCSGTGGVAGDADVELVSRGVVDDVAARDREHRRAAGETRPAAGAAAVPPMPPCRHGQSCRRCRRCRHGR